MTPYPTPREILKALGIALTFASLAHLFGPWIAEGMYHLIPW
jgi:hypothetical protein